MWSQIVYLSAFGLTFVRVRYLGICTLFLSMKVKFQCSQFSYTVSCPISIFLGLEISYFLNVYISKEFYLCKWHFTSPRDSTLGCRTTFWSFINFFVNGMVREMMTLIRQPCIKLEHCPMEKIPFVGRTIRGFYYVRILMQLASQLNTL